MAKSGMNNEGGKMHPANNYLPKPLKTSGKVNKNAMENLEKTALYKNHAENAEFYTIARFSIILSSIRRV